MRKIMCWPDASWLYFDDYNELLYSYKGFDFITVEVADDAAEDQINNYVTGLINGFYKVDTLDLFSVSLVESTEYPIKREELIVQSCNRLREGPKQYSEAELIERSKEDRLALIATIESNLIRIKGISADASGYNRCSIYVRNELINLKAQIAEE